MFVDSDSSVCFSFPVGNKLFRDAVAESLQDYMKSDNRFEKSSVVQLIGDTIREAGGRFLKRDFQLDKWYELSDQQAKEKVGHAVRDAVSAFESKESKKTKPTPTDRKQKPVRKDLSGRTLRKDSANSSGSSGAAPSSAPERLESAYLPLPSVVFSSSGPPVASRALSDSVVSTRNLNDDGQDHHFLAQIDAVLGPLPPGARDPMEPYL
jgi:hypothetical protein